MLKEKKCQFHQIYLCYLRKVCGKEWQWCKSCLVLPSVGITFYCLILVFTAKQILILAKLRQMSWVKTVSIKEIFRQESSVKMLSKPTRKKFQNCCNDVRISDENAKKVLSTNWALRNLIGLNFSLIFESLNLLK